MSRSVPVLSLAKLCLVPADLPISKQDFGYRHSHAEHGAECCVDPCSCFPKAPFVGIDKVGNFIEFHPFFDFRKFRVFDIF